MLLSFAWFLLAFEFALAAFFGYIFWHFWSRAAIERPKLVRMMLVYSVGAGLCLFLALLLPF